MLAMSFYFLSYQLSCFEVVFAYCSDLCRKEPERIFNKPNKRNTFPHLSLLARGSKYLFQRAATSDASSIQLRPQTVENTIYYCVVNNCIVLKPRIQFLTKDFHVSYLSPIQSRFPVANTQLDLQRSAVHFLNKYILHFVVVVLKKAKNEHQKPRSDNISNL